MSRSQLSYHSTVKKKTFLEVNLRIETIMSLNLTPRGKEKAFTSLFKPPQERIETGY